jgi:hypothetical protein
MAGLVAGLLSPFAAFARTPTLQAIGATLLATTLAFLYITLQAMQSSPTIDNIPTQNSVLGTKAPKADPSMQRMLNDIYGPE